MLALQSSRSSATTSRRVWTASRTPRLLHNVRVPREPITPNILSQPHPRLTSAFTRQLCAGGGGARARRGRDGRVCQASGPWPASWHVIGGLLSRARARVCTHRHPEVSYPSYSTHTRMTCRVVCGTWARAWPPCSPPRSQIGVAGRSSGSDRRARHAMTRSITW